MNGVSSGRKAVPLYGHVEWPAVTWVAGSIHAVAYANGSSTPVAEVREGIREIRQAKKPRLVFLDVGERCESREGK